MSPFLNSNCNLSRLIVQYHFRKLKGYRSAKINEVYFCKADCAKKAKLIVYSTNRGIDATWREVYSNEYRVYKPNYLWPVGR